MAYIPTSTNPHITTTMLRYALWGVTIKEAPAYCEKYIIQRLAGKLVLDSIRKKLLFVSGINNADILVDINLEDICFIRCPDADKKKEWRHRVQVKTMSSDIYEFYISTPYQSDPLPFIFETQLEINMAQNPQIEVQSKKIAPVLCLIVCIGCGIWTIIDWTNGGTIGWGIITLFISLCSGLAFLVSRK